MMRVEHNGSMVIYSQHDLERAKKVSRRLAEIQDDRDGYTLSDGAYQPTLPLGEES